MARSNGMFEAHAHSAHGQPLYTCGHCGRDVSSCRLCSVIVDAEPFVDFPVHTAPPCSRPREEHVITIPTGRVITAFSHMEARWVV